MALIQRFKFYRRTRLGCAYLIVEGSAIVEDGVDGGRLAYRDANQALNEVFFDGRFEGRPVYLTLGPRERTSIARRTGSAQHTLEDDLVAAASEIFSRSGNPYQHALNLLEHWKGAGRLYPPPFTGVLFCLAHAAERMDDAEGISQSNYYDRLEQVVGISRTSLQRYGKCVVDLWEGLNEWLSETGYRYGRPTAIPFEGAWRYVGYALSQAVVRDSDKRHFFHLFARYGFVPGETVNERDVLPYLDAWLSTASAPDRLKRRWSQTMLRSRIAAAVIDHLNEWDGTSPEDGAESGGSVRLSLALGLGGFPQKLTVKLGLQKEIEEPIEGLRRVGAPEREVGFRISNAVSATFASVSPAGEISAAQVLRYGAKFESESGRAYAYYPTDIVPFIKSTSSGLWRAVNRVRFGENHMVLVRDTSKNRADVEGILLEVSDLSRCRLATPSDLKGVPSGWLLYQDVVIKRCARGHFPDAVAVLDPLDESSSLMIDGGLRLGHGIMHSHYPFDVRFLSQAKERRIEVYQDIAGTKSEALAAKSATEGAPVRLRLTPKELAGATALSIVGFDNGKRVTSVRLLLRSADTPRPTSMHGEASSELRYYDSVSAGRSDPTQKNGFVRGFEVSQSRMSMPINRRNDDWVDMRFVAEPIIDDDLDAEALNYEAPATPVGEDGSTRHAHKWECESYTGNRPRSAPYSMECVICGKATIERNRGKTRDATRTSVVPVFKPSAEERPPLSSTHLDYLLDALCFLGHGSWNRFDEIASTFVSDGLLVRDLAQTLAVLGFVDLELVAGAASIKRWSVTPPQAVLDRAGGAFLAGFRSVSLVKNIAAWVGEAGGAIEYRACEGQPTQVYIRGLDDNAFLELGQAIKDPLGRELCVVRAAPTTILQRALFLDPPERVLIPVTLGRTDDIQKFELPKAFWRSVERVGSSGAYRLQSHGRKYCFVDNERRAFLGPYPLVKTLAARQQGFRLHDYDQNTSEFASVPGAEPPMLLARALVACSGERPAIKDGFTIYRDVPPEVASQVMQRLYTTGESNERKSECALQLG